MKTKKAQMKIQQMIFVLIAITLFFALVGIIVLKVWLSGLSQTSINLKQEQAKMLVSRLANSPEFSCGETFGNWKAACVDLDKAMALKQKSEAYKSLWGVQNIEIRIIYPDEYAGQTVDCSSGTYPNCNLLNIIGKKEGIPEENYITVCRKDSSTGETYDKCEIAIFSVIYIGSQNA
jgi:hypothetical protein